MKKQVIIGFTVLLLIYLFILISGCGGGGSTNSLPVLPTSTPSDFTPFPSTTPTIPGGITPTFFTPIPTATLLSPTSTPTYGYSPQIKIRIIDSYSGASITGKTITYGNQSVSSSPDGYYYLNNVGTGTMTVKSTSQRIINYGGVSTSFDIGIKPDSLNDVFYWACLSQVGYHQDVVYQWNTTPAIVICKQYDGAGGSITQTELDYLRYCARQYQLLIPQIQITEVDSKPESISGWSQLSSDFGIINNNRIAFYFGNFSSSVTGQGAALFNVGSYKITGGGAKMKKGVTSHQVGLHELRHALESGGEPSSYPGISGNLVPSVANYPSTGYASNELTESDKITLLVWWNRVAGNSRPDTDLAGTDDKMQIKIDNKTTFKTKDGGIVIINSDTFLP